MVYEEFDWIRRVSGNGHAGDVVNAVIQRIFFEILHQLSGS